MTAPQEWDWAVMTATDEVAVDDARQAQVGFTVTNLQREAASVTVTVVADDLAASWFTLDRPVRYVDRGASIQDTVRVVVPDDAPPADYSFQLLAYSSDTAPEERPTYSSRVLLRVPAKRVRSRRFKLILLLAGIGLAAVALITTLVVALGREDEVPEALPSATPSATETETVRETVRVPNVQGESDIEAINAKLAHVGLVADIRYLHGTRATGVIDQEPTPLEEVAPGSAVVVRVAVTLTPPTDLRATVNLYPEPLPAYGPVPLRVVADVELSWQQQEPYVQSWLVLFETCAYVALPRQTGSALARAPREMGTDMMIVNTNALRIIRHFTPPRLDHPEDQVYSCPYPRESVSVYPLDDLGLAGPHSSTPIRADLSRYSW